GRGAARGEGLGPGAGRLQPVERARRTQRLRHRGGARARRADRRMTGDSGASRRWRRPPTARRTRPRVVDAPAPTHLRPAPGPAADRRRAAADLTAAGHPHAPTPAPAALPARRADAGALAAAFGVDFLSWDESDPGRRGRALAPYVVQPVREERLAATGWAGRGRQRGELALPGAVIALSEDRLLVHVRVRVTPFRRLTGTPTCARHGPDVL